MSNTEVKDPIEVYETEGRIVLTFSKDGWHDGHTKMAKFFGNDFSKEFRDDPYGVAQHLIRALEIYTQINRPKEDLNDLTEHFGYSTDSVERKSKASTEPSTFSIKPLDRRYL